MTAAKQCVLVNCPLVSASDVKKLCVCVFVCLTPHVAHSVSLINHMSAFCKTEVKVQSSGFMFYVTILFGACLKQNCYKT